MKGESRETWIPVRSFDKFIVKLIQDQGAWKERWEGGEKRWGFRTGLD